MPLTQPVSPNMIAPTLPAPVSKVEQDGAPISMSDETKLKFEQMLWAELLTHTGLEKSLTLGGGEGASMFSRYFVEAIAADMAEKHPLGLLDDELPSPSVETLDMPGAMK
jgi:hypothetical protein